MMDLGRRTVFIVIWRSRVLRAAGETFHLSAPRRETPSTRGRHIFQTCRREKSGRRYHSRDIVLFGSYSPSLKNSWEAGGGSTSNSRRRDRGSGETSSIRQGDGRWGIPSLGIPLISVLAIARCGRAWCFRPGMVSEFGETMPSIYSPGLFLAETLAD